MENSKRDSKYLRAKERVEEIKKFYNSLISYILVIALLAGVNYYTNEWAYPWFLWAAFGWGIGLIFQATKTFGLNPFFGRDWEERKIKEYMRKDEKRTRWK